MAVMVPREKWTDERLDDLNKKVDDGFARLDADLRELRGEVKAQGESLRKEINGQSTRLRGDLNNQGNSLRGEIKAQGDSLRGEMNDLRREMNDRFDAANRNLIAFAVAIIAAVIGSNAF